MASRMAADACAIVIAIAIPPKEQFESNCLEVAQYSNDSEARMSCLLP
jgi:hypothetical protein